MSTALEEQPFVAELGEPVPMGIQDARDEDENILILDAMQHEVLMRNIPGFVS